MNWSYSLKVGNIYTFTREGNIEYSVEKAIAEANNVALF